MSPQCGSSPKKSGRNLPVVQRIIISVFYNVPDMGSTPKRDQPAMKQIYGSKNQEETTDHRCTPSSPP